MGALLSGMMYILKALSSSIMGFASFKGLIGRRGGKRKPYRRLKGGKLRWLERPLFAVLVITVLFKIQLIKSTFEAIGADPVLLALLDMARIAVLVVFVPLYAHATYAMVADAWRRVIKRWPWLVASTADLTPIDAKKLEAAFVKTLAENTGMNNLSSWP